MGLWPFSSSTEQQELLALYYKRWAMQQQMMPAPSLLDRVIQAELAYKSKNFSQHWLDSMIDIELGVHS